VIEKVVFKALARREPLEQRSVEHQTRSATNHV
jgi:hypothetical protein